MKATLQFNLDNEEDRMAHLRCMKSLDMALAMWDFAGKVKTLIDTSEDGVHIREEHLWQAWQDALNEYDINLDKLVI